MITTTADTVTVLDGSLVLAAGGGALGALLLAVAVLLVVRAARRRRAALTIRADDGSGYSAGVARVPTRGHGRERPAIDRLFGRPDRSIGLDAARGAALLGLLVVVWFDSSGEAGELTGRLGEIAGFDPDRVREAIAAVGAVVAVGLVLVSGVALALSTGGAAPAEGIERLRCRMRLAVRAVLLLAVGGVAAFSGAAFGGLVATIGALSLVAIAVLNWRARTLFLAAALVTVVVPVLASLVSAGVETAGTLIAPPLEWALSGEFPPIPLVGVLLAGLALGRMDPARPGQRWIVVAAASGCAVLAFGAGAAVSARLGATLPAALSGAPGSMTPLALLGAGGIVLALVALSLVAGRVLRWGLMLLSAAGSMALTLWIGSLVVVGAVWVLEPAGAAEGPTAVVEAAAEAGPLARLVEGVPEALRATAIAAALVLLVGVVCVVWRLALGDGPLERLVRAIARAAAGVPGVAEETVSATATTSDSVADPPAATATDTTGFDAVIRGRTPSPRAPGEGGRPAPPAPPESPGLTTPETRPVRRPTIAPVDPVTAATQWTPGQTLGRLPY